MAAMTAAPNAALPLWARREDASPRSQRGPQDDVKVLPDGSAILIA